MIIFAKRLLGIVCLSLTLVTASAQQVDLFKLQDSTNAADNKTLGNEPVINTFYSTRLVNSHTVEMLGAGSMDFRINHRFAPLNSGLYDMFGLDYASMRMGFDFGLSKPFIKSWMALSNTGSCTKAQEPAHRYPSPFWVLWLIAT
jgi:hypothetical protein